MNSEFEFQISKMYKGLWLIIGISFFALLTACTNIGDRNNPLDPHGINYVAFTGDPSSSIVNCEESAEGCDEAILSSSSNNQESSSSIVILRWSSSLNSEPAEMSSSSDTRHCEETTESCDETIHSSSSSYFVLRRQSSSSIRIVWTSSSMSIDPSEVSSSSSVEASSSSEYSWTCGDLLERGDIEYKTVLIKEQCWTKENLRYVPSEGTTMCYGDSESNCVKYGLLYDYAAAKLACPTGWRLPTSAEYVALAEYSMEGAPLYDAGAHFKSIEGWLGENGDDFLEFTALPGGKCNEEKSCNNLGKVGYWWTSTENVKDYSHYALFLTDDDDSYSATTKMTNDQYISVRCVKK